MHQYPKFYFCHKILTCFGHLLCPSSGVTRCTQGNWYVSCGLCDRFLAESGWIQPDPARKRSHNLHEAYQLPCVQWIIPDDGHRRWPKHLVFYDKNKFWILMHLVGYFYETYHDARPPEHKVSYRVDRGQRIIPVIRPINLTCKLTSSFIKIHGIIFLPRFR